MQKLLLATRNPGKLLEMEALLGGLGVQLVDADAWRDFPPVEESGEDYATNAALKATGMAALTGLWSLADDTGLEVEALGGAPGLHSSRYAGPEGTDEDRRKKLLSELNTYPRPWKARFICVVALSSPSGEVGFTHGTCPGEIIPEERGEGGFGYDSVFLIQGVDKTMAELDLTTKNQISHRAKAIMNMRPVIIKRMGTGIDRDA